MCSCSNGFYSTCVNEAVYLVLILYLSAPRPPPPPTSYLLIIVTP